MSLVAAAHPDGQTTRLIGNPSIRLIGISSTHQLRERLQSSPKEAPKITGAELFSVSEKDLASSAVRQPPMKPQVQWSPLSKHLTEVLKRMTFEHCRSCIPRGWAEMLCVTPVCLNVCRQLRTQEVSLQTAVQACVSHLATELFPAQYNCCNMEGSFALHFLSTLISQVA